MIFYYLGGVWTRFARIAWVLKGHRNINTVCFCQGAKARSSVRFRAVTTTTLTCSNGETAAALLHYIIRYGADTKQRLNRCLPLIQKRLSGTYTVSPGSNTGS